MKKRLRIVVVDDHAMFRTGVLSELSDSVDVVAEAADVDEAVAAVTSCLPDVVLLDVHLPGGGGTEVLRRTASRHPDVKFLALSVSDAAEDVIAVIRGGARLRDEEHHRTRARPRRSGGWRTETRCSRRGRPGSCSMRSPGSSGSPRSTRTWIG